MVSLTPEECRVLGVLIEKELTTPEQYPLSLNALVNGCNQKNNRDPIVEFGEDLVHDAVESLREKGLVVRVDLAGSRVHKYKEQAGAKIPVNRYELVLLAELLLRGPQTLGELRGRASRMHHLDSLEVVKEMLDQLAGRPEPLVRQVSPAPGSRAERYIQLLCPDAHPIDAPAAGLASTGASITLSHRIQQLELEVTILRQAVQRLALGLGEPDPTADWPTPPGN